MKLFCCLIVSLFLAIPVLAGPANFNSANTGVDGAGTNLKGMGYCCEAVMDCSSPNNCKKKDIERAALLAGKIKNPEAIKSLNEKTK